MGFNEYLNSSSRYENYLYAYPHKTAYRPFEKRIPLDTLWRKESKKALFLYAHLPFCTSKCSFCNLFSIAGASDELIQKYLQTIALEAEIVKDLLSEFNYSGFAVGGGTPGLLSIMQIEQLFSIFSKYLNVAPERIHGSFEISPETTTAEKVVFLKRSGIHRLSIGIQSFIESEARLMGRLHTENVPEVLDIITDAGFPLFNIDLIYGIDGQTRESWLYSLRTALLYNPDEIYLYPLYKRPKTYIYKNKNEYITDQRAALYYTGRDYLLENGYVQDSMRCFRKGNVTISQCEYSCQENGMTGLGANARSYTAAVHYTTPYAVSRKHVLDIITQYCNKNADDFRYAGYGMHLDVEEQKRRYLIKSILKVQGLHMNAYRQHFGTEPADDFPSLHEIARLSLGSFSDGFFRLNDEGIARSDQIGHYFISKNVLALMNGYNLQ